MFGAPFVNKFNFHSPRNGLTEYSRHFFFPSVSLDSLMKGDDFLKTFSVSKLKFEKNAEELFQSEY